MLHCAHNTGTFAGTVLGNAAPGYRIGTFLIDPLNANVSGTIAANTTVWAQEDITIQGNVTINSGVTLTLLADHLSATPGNWDDGSGGGVLGTGLIKDPGGNTITASSNTSALIMYAGGGGIGTSANPLLTSLNGAGLTVITNNPSQVGAAKTYIQNDGTGLKIVNIAAAGGTNDNTVSISSGGSITQTGAINISGAATSGLELLGAGTYTLNGASNNVPILAASLTGAGSLTYVNNAALTLGTVNSTAGITTAGGLANVSSSFAMERIKSTTAYPLPAETKAPRKR